MSTILDQSTQARVLWLGCLGSALRTALACAIVGAATLYGPRSLLRQIAFPAFSYVTVILVITDATLGDTVRGCWLALYATFQTLGPAILSLWLIRPARLTCGTTALAVALAAFVVALPQSTHLVAKRIGLGQIVITYVLAYIYGDEVDAVMHPLHVAASTAVGVLACFLALLLPFPRLACSELKESCKSLGEIASERIELLVMAFCSEDKSSASGFFLRAKPLGVAATKLLQNIKRYHKSMEWERLPLKLLQPYYCNPVARLQGIEIPLRGMEMALNSCSFPIRMLDKQLKDGLVKLEELAGPSLKQNRSSLPRDSPTVPEPDAENLQECLQTLQSIPKTHKELPPFFFLFCIRALQEKIFLPSTQKESIMKKEQSRIWNKWTMDINLQSLIPAFKCSLSLGLAILLGSIYSKENGFWAGLPVAISHAVGREATFRVSNVKLQGTVLGTVYGVLGCFLFQRFLIIRFLTLVPWFIFTSFLRQSKMYGPAGGISSVIGAVLILGRKNFGTPKEFAIARIVETFIGLGCAIMVELIFQPTRASTLAKVQLSRSLSMLYDCTAKVSLRSSRAELKEKQKKLRSHVNELGKVIGDADVEPNFWFLPFHSACYNKLLVSLSKMGDLLHFSADALGFLEQESKRFEACGKDVITKLEDDLEQFRKAIRSSVKCFGEANSFKSLTLLEKELEKKNISYDVELGKTPRARRLDEEEIEKIVFSFLQRSQKVVDKIHGDEDEKELRSQTIISLTALVFCLANLTRETRAIEEGIKEVLQWENPSSQINLYDISCKVQAVKK